MANAKFGFAIAHGAHASTMYMGRCGNLACGKKSRSDWVRPLIFQGMCGGSGLKVRGFAGVCPLQGCSRRLQAEG